MTVVAAVVLQQYAVLPAELRVLRSSRERPRDFGGFWTDLSGRFAHDTLGLARAVIPEDAAVRIGYRPPLDRELPRRQAAYALYPRPVDPSPGSVRTDVYVIGSGEDRIYRADRYRIVSVQGDAGRRVADSYFVAALGSARFAPCFRERPSPRVSSVSIQASAGGFTSGTVTGEGFQPDDFVLLDERDLVAATFRDAGSLSFEIPDEILTLARRIAVARLSTFVRSNDAALPLRADSAPSTTADAPMPLMSGVSDVRHAPLVRGGPRLVVGSVLGSGFRPGDVVLIDGRTPADTAYGNDRWMSFSFSAPDPPAHFQVSILRPSTRSVSASVRATLPRPGS